MIASSMWTISCCEAAITGRKYQYQIYVGDWKTCGWLDIGRVLVGTNFSITIASSLWIGYGSVLAADIGQIYVGN